MKITEITTIIKNRAKPTLCKDSELLHHNPNASPKDPIITPLVIPIASVITSDTAAKMIVVTTNNEARIEHFLNIPQEVDRPRFVILNLRGLCHLHQADSLLLTDSRQMLATLVDVVTATLLLPTNAWLLPS